LTDPLFLISEGVAPFLPVFLFLEYGKMSHFFLGNGKKWITFTEREADDIITFQMDPPYEILFLSGRRGQAKACSVCYEFPTVQYGGDVQNF
jgi:hypothetical protein